MHLFIKSVITFDPYYNIPERVEVLNKSLNFQVKIRGGEVWSLGI
jgi:hypothetical protein